MTRAAASPAGPPSGPLAAPVGSPCTGVCRIDARSGWCEGCCRSLDEIAAWSTLDDGAKLAIWRALPQRRPTPAAPRTGG